MELFILCCWIAWPILSYNLAKGKGLNTGTAVVCGVLFGVFAVLYYWTAPKVEGI